MKIKKHGIIISKKILKKKDIKLLESFYKTKQVGKLIKFLKLFIKLNMDIFFRILKIYKVLEIFLLTE